MLLKVSTARDILIFMTNSTDNISGVTGLSAGLTIGLSKNGATSFSTITPTVQEVANGFYVLSLTTTHTNTKGAFNLYITASGCIPTIVEHEVVTDLPGDTIASVSGAVGSVTGNIGGNVVGSVASVVAVVDANLKQILGTLLTETSGQIAAAFKKFFDIASPTSTMNLITRTTLTDTVTTYTGNTPQTGDNFARIGSPVGASISADIAGVKTVADAVKLKTDNIPASPATAAAVAAIPTTDNTSNISAIKAKTDNLPASPAAMVWKKNTQKTISFLMWDDDGNLAAGLTVTATRSLDNGVFASASNAVTDIGGGKYQIVATTTELNTTETTFKFTATDCRESVVTIYTESAS